MISMPPEKAEGYIDELRELDGCDAWIVGKVVADPNRKAKVSEDLEVLEV